MNPNEYEELKNANFNVCEIIGSKKLHFFFFFITDNYYQYNNAVAHELNYRKLTFNEYRNCEIVIKRKYELL